MLVIKETHQYSFRETIRMSKSYFKKVPSLWDFHYRASKLKDKIQILIKLICYLQKESVETIIVDGMGIGRRRK